VKLTVRSNPEESFKTSDVQVSVFEIDGVYEEVKSD